jgi:ABC-2 type transport system permease protein
VRRLLAQVGHLVGDERRSVLIWGVYLGALGAMYIALYPSLSNGLEQYLNSAPANIMHFLGIQAGGPLTPRSWLALEMFNLVGPLALPFFAILAGSRAVAGAEERGRLDIYLSNPVPRWQVIVGSFMAQAAGLAGILALLWLLIWLAALAAGVTLGAGAILAGVANLWPFSLFFGGLALMLSSVVRRSQASTSAAAVILLLMYVVNALGNISSAMKPFRRFSLFYHYGSAIEHGVAWTSFLVTLAIALGFMALAIVAFNRRDIYT